MPVAGRRVRRNRGVAASRRNATSPTARFTWTTSARAKVTDTYTLKGQGTEIYEPRFTYHGFRYVEVTGFPGKPTLVQPSKGASCTTIWPAAGDFACSNPLLNQIYHEYSLGRARQLPQHPHRLPAARRAPGLAGRPLGRMPKAKPTSSTSRRSTPSGSRTWHDAQRDTGSIPDVVPDLLAALQRRRHLAQLLRHHSRHMLYDQFGDECIIARPVRRREAMDRVHERFRQGRPHAPRLLRRLVRAARVAER